MNKLQAENKLKTIHQEHLLKFWSKLSPLLQKQLLDQIDCLDLKQLEEQKSILKHPPCIQYDNIVPYRNYSISGNQEDYYLGKDKIKSGKTGCILVAGGQGTRLQFDGLKGMFPITKIRHKSLFQVFAEKVVAASKQANTLLPLAIMTSPLNDRAIREFFQFHNNFGLLNEQLFFFSQELYPFLDIDGNLFLDSPHTIAMGPNGNGYSLKYFVKNQIAGLWKDLGIEFVNFIQVDNPLADPFDAELIGYHERNGASITLKSVFRREAQEKVGVLVVRDNIPQVIEYTELPMKERVARSGAEELKHRCANISLFCFSMDFIQECATKTLPLHTHFKTASKVDSNGDTQVTLKPNAWKFETFIFDTILFSSSFDCLVYPRKACFSPLKNAEGISSVATVQNDLQERDVQVVKSISGCQSPNLPFELSQDFYYPTPYLLSVWENRPFPNIPYITEGS